MIFNTLLTSIRFLFKSKIFTAINLNGLVLGLTASFILFIYIVNEFSYNKDFPNADRMYRVVSLDQAQKSTDAMTPFILSKNLKEYFSQIELTARLINVENLIGSVKIKKKTFFQLMPGFFCADASLMQMLGIKTKGLKGSDTLKNIPDLLISSSVASGIFGRTNPVGKTCEIQINGKLYRMQIQGVFEDLPWNSTIQPAFLAGIRFYKELLKEITPDSESILGSNSKLSNETYVLFRKKGDILKIRSQIASFCKQNNGHKSGLIFVFQPFTDIHLHSADFLNDFNPKGNNANIMIFIMLASFILFLAGINYAILSTARAALRYKEIGVRKVFGATKNQLRGQILVESILLTLIAFPLALLLLGLMDPIMENLFGHAIAMYPNNLVTYLSIFTGITLLIGFLSGIYIAFYLASLDPLFALKMRLFAYKRFTLSKIFLVFQLFITLSLLIGFLTVYEQISYCLNKDLGLKKENLLIIHFNSAEFDHYASLKKMILRNQAVLKVSGSSVAPPTNAATSIKAIIPGTKHGEITMERYFIDYGFFETMGIKLNSGYDFNPRDSLLNQKKILLNTEAIQQLDFKDPLSKRIGPFYIIGVSDNFNISTMHQQIQPTMFCFLPSACQNILVRYKTGSQQQLITDIEKYWHRLAPDLPFNYSFFNTELETLYNSEKNFGRVVASFTFLAFIITGMGMFGLAFLITERRRKEIAVRKILGATNIHIITRLQREFYYYIGIAALISIPVSLYFMNMWLNTFYYRIPIKGSIFAISVCSVCLFISGILLYRTIKVLKEKPIDVLKYE